MQNTMEIPHLDITALPLWSRLNNVSLLDIQVTDLGASKGFGLVASRKLNSKDVSDVITLLVVPNDSVLDYEAIDMWANTDDQFGELCEHAGGSHRAEMMLFLLMQITIASKHHDSKIGLTNPWVDYVKMMPKDVPLPTLWSDEEKFMLTGTSLEAAVSGKTKALMQEFDKLRKDTSGLAWCQKCWWENENLSYHDWFLIDAWYRSRCLEIPNSKECMVPCIDMVNHSSQANSFYERKPDGTFVLLLRPGIELDTGSEVTISYGSAKTHAEMLFSYGFIDQDSNIQGLTTYISPFPDDPLGKAKVVAFSKPPSLRIFEIDGMIQWESAFVHFACVNEEDGLEFRVLQENNGAQHLRVFWQGTDVTGATDTFDALTLLHPLKDVFRLRVNSMLQERIQEQLASLYGVEDAVQALEANATIHKDRYSNAMRLRESEIGLLELALEEIKNEESILHQSEVVLRYLGSAEDDNRPEPAEANEEEDFS